VEVGKLPSLLANEVEEIHLRYQRNVREACIERAEVSDLGVPVPQLQAQ
jgi:hypothetical protein